MRRPIVFRPWAAPFLALAVACGGSSSHPGSQYTGTPPTSGTAITATTGTDLGNGWRWIDVDGTVCDDPKPGGGYTTSATGFAIKLGTAKKLVVFLDGGGACWDFYSCGGAPQVVQTTATTGPFGAAQATTRLAALPGSILDPAVLTPLGLADASLVFVPYCTGDVHSGDRVTTYPPPPGLNLPSITWEHRGHHNVMLDLERLGATFQGATAPDTLLVSGSSAGGFGSTANYPAFRWYWPAAKSYLVDDSGPPLIGSAIPPASRAQWDAAWGLEDATIRDVCGSACDQDLSMAVPALAGKFPEDHLALLSYTQDAVIRGFFYTLVGFTPTPMSAQDFENALNALATQRFDPLPNAKVFYETGALDTPTARPATTHTMLGAVSTHVTGATPGVNLLDWLQADVAGTGPASPWKSEKP